MLAEPPATTAISFSPPGVRTLPAISGGNRLCICRGWLSSLIFHSSFISFTLPFVRLFSFRCHAVRGGSPPSVSQSAFGVCAYGAATHGAAAANATTAASHRRYIEVLLSRATLRPTANAVKTFRERLPFSQDQTVRPRAERLEPQAGAVVVAHCETTPVDS